MRYDFTIDGYEDPGPSVLEFGLPDLPADLPVGHGLAVARWVDGDFGVVLVVYRNDPEFHKQIDETDAYDYDVQPYIRVDGAWVTTSGSGGSGWQSPPFERFVDIPRFGVRHGHRHTQEGDTDTPAIRVVDGVAGEGVVSIEIRTPERTAIMPIESPIGAWVTGVVGDGPCWWIARDADGRVAASGSMDGDEGGWSDWMMQRISTVGELESNYDEDGNGGFVWTIGNDVMPADLAMARDVTNNGDRIPGETYIQTEDSPQWQRIADDLFATTGIELEVRSYPHVIGLNFIDDQVWLNGLQHGTLARQSGDSPPESLLAEFAETLCDEYFYAELLRDRLGFKGELQGHWPLCPTHKTLPLEPEVSNQGVAVWACPDGATGVRIGNLTNEF